MKQINFSHEGGFPLEQESLERLQTAYRSELFGALKAHLSIGTNQNYIVAPATNATKGWVVIQQDESNLNDSETALPITEGILYPVNKGDNTGYLKTTRTGTSLVYGTGLSQTAYYDYEADYISQAEFVSGISQDSDALKVYYHDLSTFKVVKDLTAIEGILEAINAKIGAIESNIDAVESNIDSVETAINVINQTYLPLDGSKAMTGDFSMSSKRLLQPTNSTGKALVNSSDAITSSLSLNYQSDWQNTSIGGKVYLENLSTTNSTGSLLVVDGSNQVTKSNSLLELLNRITVLESKISTATAFPIGMIAIWGRPANEIPDGWEEYVPLRGRVPVGVDISDPLLNKTRNQGGSKNAVVVSHDHTISNSGNINDGKTGDEITDKIARWDRGSGSLLNGIVSTVGESGTNKNMQPYSVVHFIEYTGNPSDQKAPTTPTNLEASKIGTKSLTLSWNASTDNVGVTNYLVYKESILLEIVDSNVVSFPVTGLTAGTSYSFSVIARDTAGNLSTPATLTQATIAVDLTAPTIPNYLHCYTQGKGLIGLEWGTSTDYNGPITYELWRTVDGFAYFIFDTTNNTYSSDSGLPNSTYSYKVRARDSNGNMSAFTNEASITISSL